MSRTIVDISGLVKKLHAVAPNASTVLDREFMKSARLLVSSPGNVPGLVQVTPPHSQGVKGIAAKKQGEAAVARDVRRVYGTPGRLFARVQLRDRHAADAFWAAVKRKDWETANEISTRLVGSDARLVEFDDGAAHARLRDARTGRVRQRIPGIFIAREKWINDYIRAKQKNVGMLAAAPVVAAGNKLGLINGVPAWVARHHVNWARVYDVGDGMQREVTIVVAAPYAVADLQRRFDYVARYRFDALKRQLPYLVNHALKRSRLA